MIWLNFLSHQQNGCFSVWSTEMSVIIFKIIPKLIYIKKHIILLLNYISWTSVMVQLLRLRDSTIGAEIPSQVRELRFHMPHRMAKKKFFLIKKTKFKEINYIFWILTDGINHFSRSAIYNFYWQHVTSRPLPIHHLKAYPYVLVGIL